MSKDKCQIILGSASPRRRELLAGLGVPFEVVAIEADESYPSQLQGGDIPLYISRAKAQAYAERLRSNELLITADTIVWCDGRMLGKPHDAEEAKRMLRALSGKTHQVFTAVSFAQRKTEDAEVAIESEVDRTDVTFGTLTEEAIDFYVREYGPMDKAGAYGIQEWIGLAACTRIEGSYFTVMGFPTHLVYQKLVEKNNF